MPPPTCPAGAEVVYSTAIPPDNPERQAAGTELHRADLLAQIAALRRCLAVTGTHGKTTTSAMAVQALQGAGLDPAYVVGGELRSTHSNAGWGSGEWIVVEADESDRSLLKLQPEIAVLTNAELDHHSTYASRLDLERTFAEFMSRAGERAVVWDRPALRALCPGGGVPYDAPGAELDPEGSRFTWRDIEVRLAVPGAHNAVNAAGALTACALAGADPAAAAAALAEFRGARRRMERVGETRGRRRGLRRLRPPPHRGGHGDRGGAHSAPSAAGGRVPAASVLAHARAGATPSASRWPPPTRSSCWASIPPGSAPRTSPA